MPIIIREVVTEVVLDRTPPGSDGEPAAGTGQAVDVDLIVRRASERVLETLRREWDR